MPSGDSPPDAWPVDECDTWPVPAGMRGESEHLRLVLVVVGRFPFPAEQHDGAASKAIACPARFCRPDRETCVQYLPPQAQVSLVAEPFPANKKVNFRAGS